MQTCCNIVPPKLVMRACSKYLLPILCLMAALYGYVAMMHNNETDGEALSIVSCDANVHQQNETHNKLHTAHAHKTFQERKHPRKLSHVRHIRFEAMPMGLVELPHYVFFEKPLLPVIDVAYRFTFCRDITPPPPKAC